MHTTHAPNTDPLPTAPSCIRSGRNTSSARWNPYLCGSGSRSAPPTVRRDSTQSKPSPGYTLPISPRLTPESGPSSGQRSTVPTIEEISDLETKHQVEAKESHKMVKKYEYTDDFIDVLLGILSLIYCSPLLIAGGRTFVIPQNFATQPPPSLPSNQPTPITVTSLTHSKPNHMRWFVERLLERTRPPRAVCQLAVSYLLSLTDAVQGELKTAAETRLRTQSHGYPMAINGGGGVPAHVSAPRAQTPDNQLPPPYSALPAPTIIIPAHSQAVGMPPLPTSLSASASSSALLDPRRVLLAVMVLAHKFHLDKTWTNKAWGKISGLTPIEVGRCERTVAIALGHRLWRA